MKTFLVKHKNFDIRLKSRSGGIFTALSDYILENNGVISGVVLENITKAKHICTTSAFERDLMRGSKYIQSNIGENFMQIKKLLSQGKFVLFSGTPCQVFGLKCFLKNIDYPNLLTMDIVCHGVPSNRVWEDYVKFLEEKNGTKIVDVNFRNKIKFGWQSHVETFYFEDNTSFDSTLYKDMFYGHEILRPSCNVCKFKNLDRVSDITIGDAWGVTEANPNFNDDNGVSLVLLNSKKGEDFFSKCLDKIDYLECDINKYKQPPLRNNFDLPKRNSFWKFYNKNSFLKVKKRYEKIVIRRKIINKIFGR